MDFNIAVIEGDGIGPEIVGAAVEVLDTVGRIFRHNFNYDWLLAGGNSIDKYGVPLTNETLSLCKNSDSVLLAAVGGYKWEHLPGHLRPEKALLTLRKELNLFANIRPATLLPALRDACPLRSDIVEKGFDMVIVRELTGGIYYGKRGRSKDGKTAFDTETYSEEEVERIGRIAFELARQRRKTVCSVDKANVLESSRLWRETMHKVAQRYPDVKYSDMLVDNAAMQLIRDPSQFDVIVTGNMFGDILSDEASQLTGSIGMLPSASLGSSKCGLYEPIHGSAPDIAGLGIANPIATILSAAMMLRLSFGLAKEAATMELAVSNVLAKGYRTKDIARKDEPFVTCREMTKLIINEIEKVTV
jgi:3-isopropylmalate dehydrogenase